MVSGLLEQDETFLYVVVGMILEMERNQQNQSCSLSWAYFGLELNQNSHHEHGPTHLAGRFHHPHSAFCVVSHVYLLVILSVDGMMFWAALDIGGKGIFHKLVRGMFLVEVVLCALRFHRSTHPDAIAGHKIE